MKLEEAVARVRLGESIAQIADAYRVEVMRSMGLTSRDVGPETFRKDARLFVNRLCRELADRCAGDRKIALTLRTWVEGVADYEAWDALLSAFDFEGKARWIERGRAMFAGPMTAHWSA